MGIKKERKCVGGNVSPFVELKKERKRNIEDTSEYFCYSTIKFGIND